MTSRNRKHFVYVMAMYPVSEDVKRLSSDERGWRKVGISSNPAKRRIQIQTSSPFLVRLEAAIELPSKGHAKKAEMVCHAVLGNHFECRREWFYASHDEIESIVLAVAKRASDQAALAFSWYSFVRENADMWQPTLAFNGKNKKPHMVDPTGAHAFDLSTKH